MKKVNWQFVIIMLTLISWMAFAGRWIGKIETKVTSNETSNYNLSLEINKLTQQLSETNKILYEIKGKMK